MLIDPEDAGEGKVTRDTSLCYTGLINIEPSIDAVSNKPDQFSLLLIFP
jgi:hypothetical protein